LGEAVAYVTLQILKKMADKMTFVRIFGRGNKQQIEGPWVCGQWQTRIKNVFTFFDYSVIYGFTLICFFSALCVGLIWLPVSRWAHDKWAIACFLVSSRSSSLDPTPCLFAFQSANLSRQVAKKNNKRDTWVDGRMDIVPGFFSSLADFIRLSADHTAACSMIGYCRDNVVSVSACLSVLM